VSRCEKVDGELSPVPVPPPIPAELKCDMTKTIGLKQTFAGEMRVNCKFDLKLVNWNLSIVNFSCNL
jgi:hypothetical protein